MPPETNLKPLNVFPHVMGGLFCVTTFFINLAVNNVGLFVLMLLAYSAYAFLITVSKDFRIPIVIRARPIFFAHIFFIFTLALSFFINGSTQPADIQYLMSSAINLLWLPVFLIVFKWNKNLFLKFFQNGLIGLSILIILVWLVMVVLHRDLFFLRNSTSDTLFLNASIFYNVNFFARILFICATMIYFFHRNNRSKIFFGQFILPFFVLILFSTLSRSVIIALLLVSFLLAVVEIKKQNVVRKILFTVVTAVIFSTSMLLLMPKIMPRTEDAIGKFKSIQAVLAGEQNLKESSRRVRTWMVTLMVLKDHWVAGIGYSKADRYLADYGSIYYGGEKKGETIRIHGGFLKYATYGGFVSMAGLLVFFGASIFTAARIFFTAADRPSQHAAFCLVLLLLSLIPINIGADCFGLSFTWMSIAFLTVNLEPFNN